MAKHKRNKHRVKKVVLAPGEIAAVEVPKGHTPLVATIAEEQRVEIVPVPVKKKRWWETLLYGEY